MFIAHVYCISLLHIFKSRSILHISVVLLLSFVVWVLGRFLVVLGVSLFDFWLFWGGLSGVLGGLGGSWAAPGRSWVGLGRSRALLGRSWPILDRSWPLLGRSWLVLSRSWLVLGRSWLVKTSLSAVFNKSIVS